MHIKQKFAYHKQQNLNLNPRQSFNLHPTTIKLRQFIQKSGCFIHPSVQIPSFINNYQGVLAVQSIPPKTLIIAIPSKLILTVEKCYKTEYLKKIYKGNDELFDYEESDEAEFNVLCVFLMYYYLRMEKDKDRKQDNCNSNSKNNSNNNCDNNEIINCDNNENSNNCNKQTINSTNNNINNKQLPQPSQQQLQQWQLYLQTIGQPQTAISWPNHLLSHLPKSILQQIIHIRIQCTKLQSTLCQYLRTTPQFAPFSYKQLTQAFNYCYQVVMTRCFGYYFNQTSLIPVADMINHGCEVVDHQLINVDYQKKLNFIKGIKSKCLYLDQNNTNNQSSNNEQHTQQNNNKNTKSSSLSFNPLILPFRQRFLIQNKLIQNNLASLQSLSRKKISSIIKIFNHKLFFQSSSSSTLDIQSLQFCQQEDDEDNDTDQEEENNKQIQMNKLRDEELEQIQNFKKYFDKVKVEKYKDVRKRLEEMEQKDQKKKNLINQNEDKDNVRQNKIINQSIIHNHEEKSTKQCNNNLNILQNINHHQQQQQKTTQNILKQQQQDTITKNSQNPSQSIQQKTPQSEQKTKQKQPDNLHLSAHLPTQLFPLKPVQSQSDSQQSNSSVQSQQKWGLLPSSYFTMSTSSAVSKGKQLFNSYGSRTNKFLLVWYGFCYRDNLYDSVSLRLHVKFGKKLPNVKDFIIDTYVAGQGVYSFKKNQQQIVKTSQISKQFRIKRSCIPNKLITFLRLYLLDYYKQKDLYKICITIPSSISYEKFLFSYYQQILLELYERYPLTSIEQLYSDLQNDEKYQEQDKTKINFKIIFLQQQRKILDQQYDAIKCVKKFLENLQNLQKEMNLQQEVGELNQNLINMPRKLYDQFRTKIKKDKQDKQNKQTQYNKQDKQTQQQKQAKQEKQVIQVKQAKQIIQLIQSKQEKL